MTRKNYHEYKDGLPAVELTEAKLMAIAQKHHCVKCAARIDGKRIRIRVRLKPARKLSPKQEIARLCAENKRLRAQLKGV